MRSPPFARCLTSVTTHDDWSNHVEQREDGQLDARPMTITKTYSASGMITKSFRDFPGSSLPCQMTASPGTKNHTLHLII